MRRMELGALVSLVLSACFIGQAYGDDDLGRGEYDCLIFVMKSSANRKKNIMGRISEYIFMIKGNCKCF